MRKLGLLTAAAAIALFATGAALAEPSDLISVWQFDEDADEFAGGVVRDSVDGNDGNIDGAISSSWPGAIFGRAVDFDGTDDQITVPNVANLDFTAAYTLEAWVNSDDASLTNLYRPIFVRGADDDATNANDIEVYIQANSRDLIVAHNRGNGGTFDFVGFADPPLGAWFHLAVVFDGTDVQAYYNGVLATVVQQSTVVTAPLDTDRDWLLSKVNHSAFNIASSGRQHYFDGLMDEVRFWDSALTAGEVAASHALAGISTVNGVDMNSAKPGVEAVSTEGVLTFFIASVYDVPASETNVVVCISPDMDVVAVDIRISGSDAFDLRRWSAKQAGSSWDEAASDVPAFANDPCAVATAVDFSADKKAKTLHLDLNLVDINIGVPLTGGTGVIVDSIGVNIQKNPLGG